MENFLKSISKQPINVIDESILIDNYVPISISSENTDLQSFDISSSKEWEEYITSYLKKNNGKVAYGGYLEKRDIYNRSKHFSKESEENQRNIHLGIDLWCNAGTSVLALLDGEIHSFKNNTNFGDYGPTIILKHTINNKVFYSLYGHLSINSIKDITIGQKVRKGEVIGFLGDSSVNGDYAPHLHFQLIIDLGGNFGDYPGVCAKKDVEFYKNNCPNPLTLLKINTMDL
ncbi:peptidoglycan DD-metalloendopeptidase family protein [Tenacibaculum sp. IB213877]|uniref:peptidoglycan DD-metalloendopeptidase family protein n=1 Tax=Tenacibaculum sp. IB213877 TaxID=3097351 RepID=UPI002A5AFC5C|nr:peptidoglycan DD-metalloendopeptidase family protein [Tenacibaculum sp. IB213877]MDY0779649.1 peptidoglycan DD-metalloendopeptidase family protein [Tenacibaculum sp. IB213877]